MLDVKSQKPPSECQPCDQPARLTMRFANGSDAPDHLLAILRCRRDIVDEAEAIVVLRLSV
jgi:hypothetical protein